ncbi:MAG: tRNA (5-methylaminomethyl-2-thiouridine)(34)-methyltransferase MnmD [Bacteroidales bacterium]|jgi:tRNA U34 5-methylaminomethyl-2-thiouridine-forming methyltransferase MnmC|nr:tRNA (5-methylaminomethyl-2-thiouridine)(34)-methyltransferase MnmD [Bacteroidales bacterium]
MDRELCLTADGSYTLYVPSLNEHYHSVNGALGESLHVYIKAGLMPLLKHHASIHILEIGLGTALNLVLTEAFTRDNVEVFYTAIEPYPLLAEEVKGLNYSQIYPAMSSDILQQTHIIPFDNQFHELRPRFKLKKYLGFLQSFDCNDNKYNLVYFDAFAPDVQTELWEEKVFENLYKSMKSGGILCTYSAKGEVRRIMEKVGFKVERLTGFTGKREMLRAQKT